MCKHFLRRSGVIVLTLVAILQTGGCSYLHRRFGEQCKSHAYLQNNLADFISTRFHRSSPVRMAIVPFSVEENIAPRGAAFPGLSNELAWKVHAAFLANNAVPIVEVLNRQDWPGKKEEFFTGNFGALSMAREAGYDLVMVGYLDRRKNLDSMEAYTKIMDVESGITVWYGKSVTKSVHRDMTHLEDYFWITDRDPSLLYSNELVEKMAGCIYKAASYEPS